MQLVLRWHLLLEGQLGLLRHLNLKNRLVQLAQLRQ
jgi:hypothetical protein